MPRTTRLSESAEGICPVCSETINIFAIGMCDHPVCYSCSTRMRVLSEQLQCAICRVEIPKVIFIQHLAKYEETDTYNFQVFRKYKIYFENDSVQEAFYELLDHACQLCKGKKFRTFALLRDHMRKEHTLYYCDLCVNYLKVFTHQRKFYDRIRLALHRRQGDEDDKSHRGHPLCEFCDERFLDNDELVRHLRKEHYYCHFCDAENTTNQFYSEYSDLREHFKECHYLCEEGECLHAEFINAFREDIDLKAHAAIEHVNKLRKSHARQTRTLDIGFSLTPRPGHGAGGRRDRDRDRGDRDRDRGNRNWDSDQGGRGPRKAAQDNCVAVVTGEDYEEVQQDKYSRSGRGKGRGGRGRNYGADQRYTDYREDDTVRAISTSLADHLPVPLKEDFPSLDGQMVNEPELQHDVKHDHDHSNQENMASFVARNNNFSVSNGPMEEEDFPSLVNEQKSFAAGDGNACWAFKPSSKDFPVLGSSQNSNPAVPKTGSGSWQTKGSKAAGRPLPTGSNKRQSAQSVVYASPRPPKSLSSIGNALLSTSKPSSNGDAKPFAVPVKSSDDKDFPVLGALKPAKQMRAITKTQSSSRKASLESAIRKNAKTVEALFDEEFPSLGGHSGAAPQPTVAPIQTKEVEVQSIAMKKLQNQQKHFENELFDQPIKEPPTEIPKKTQSKPAKGNMSALVKKEDSSAKVGKVHTDNSPKYSQLKKVVMEEVNKSYQETSNEEKWQTQPSSKSNSKSSLEETVKELQDEVSEEQWEVSHVEKTKEKKKVKKKAEKFEEEYPSLSSANSATVDVSATEWGKRNKTKKLKEPENDTFEVLKTKKKKGSANKQKAEEEPEPTWGYDPHFVEPVIPKVKPKEPPGLVYKENKEPKRDKDEPWGRIVDNMDSDDFPSLFKSDEVLSAVSALKDQSNFSLATLTANIKGFSANPLPIKAAIPALVNDFPILGGFQKTPPPPGLGFVTPVSKALPPPPPGFVNLSEDDDASNVPAAKPLPPPGFSAASSVELPVSEQENNNLPPVEYQKPDHFIDRNMQLISDVQGYLGDSEEKFLRFKKSSGHFRQGKMSGSDYYDACMNIIGADGFLNIFGELLVLLPDIDKQHELLVAHTASKQPKKGMTTKKEKIQRKAWAKADSIFTVCPTCRQVLVDADVAGHGTEHHMDVDFPTLGAVPGNKYGFSAWVKGN